MSGNDAERTAESAERTDVPDVMGGRNVQAPGTKIMGGPNAQAPGTKVMGEANKRDRAAADPEDDR